MNIKEHSDLINAVILLLSWKVITKQEHDRIVNSINAHRFLESQRGVKQ